MHLWPDEENLAAEEQDSTVVQRRSMQDGHSDVADDPIRRIRLEELGQDIPRVEYRIAFEEVIKAAIARNF